jgi:hypothetical protein
MGKISLDKINALYEKFPYTLGDDTSHSRVVIENIIQDEYDTLMNSKDEIMQGDMRQNLAMTQFHMTQKFKEHLYSVGLKTHIVDGLAIPINPSWRRVGLDLSGGADSAAMALVLCKIIEENNYDIKIEIITFMRCWETRPWQFDIALRVYNELKARFPNIIGERHLTFIPPQIEHGAIGPLTHPSLQGSSGDQVIVYTYNRFMAHNLKLDAVYNATTKNPTVDTPTEDRMKTRDVNEEDIEINQLAYVSDNGVNWALEPLRLVEKDWVLQQYLNNNEIALFNATRSCEGDCNHPNLMGMDAKWYQMHGNPDNVPECGDCFWCQERNWAKQQLGIS